MRELIYIFLLLLFPITLSGQTLTQTIRGNVLDKDSQLPLIGATIQSANKGTTTDINGNFRLEQMPLGRHELVISYLGYEDKIIPNIIVNSSKEVLLSIAMQESIADLETVVVLAAQDKSSSINEMATISARQFTVEEAGRYAGSRNEPSRMAQNYAGVSGSSDSRNDLIIRGNSPLGLLW